MTFIVFINAFASAWNVVVYVSNGAAINLGCAVFSFCIMLWALVRLVKP